MSAHPTGADGVTDIEVIDPKPEDILDPLESAAKSAVAKFDPLKAGLAAMEEKYKDYVPDLSTAAGEKIARANRKELVTLRSSAKEVYEELNKPLLEAQRQARALRDEIITKAEGYETPIDAAIKADEAKKAAEKKAREEAETARIAAIRQRITTLASIPVQAVGMDSATIDAVIDDLGNLDLSPDRFGEFVAEATVLVGEVASKLAVMRDAAVAQEAEAKRLADERAELDRLRREAAEREEADKKRRDTEAAAAAQALADQQADIDRQRREFAEERAKIAAADAAKEKLELKRQEDAFEAERQAAIDAANAQAAADAETSAALNAEEAAIVAEHGKGVAAKTEVIETPDTQLAIDIPHQVHQASAVLRPTGRGDAAVQAAAEFVDAEPQATFVRPADAPSDIASDYDYLVALARGIGATPLETLLRIRAMDFEAVFAAVMADDEVPA